MGSFKMQQEILHILTISGRQIADDFALAIKNSQILMLNRITFQKIKKFGYYFRFPSIYFLETSGLYSCFIIKHVNNFFSFLLASSTQKNEILMLSNSKRMYFLIIREYYMLLSCEARVLEPDCFYSKFGFTLKLVCDTT